MRGVVLHNQFAFISPLFRIIYNKAKHLNSTLCKFKRNVSHYKKKMTKQTQNQVERRNIEK